MAACLESAARSSRRLLVIDDDIDAAETLGLLLNLRGDEAVVACSGSAALEAARSAPPDLVLCDIGMPGMDGHAVARAFRAEPALKDVPLVALTGRVEADGEALEDSGFRAWLLKPADFDTVSRTIDRLLAG